MNKQIKQLLDQSTYDVLGVKQVDQKQFAELIMQDMHRKVIASILITDVVMEAKGLTPTSEDYIRAINKDFGVEE